MPPEESLLRRQVICSSQGRSGGNLQARWGRGVSFYEALGQPLSCPAACRASGR